MQNKVYELLCQARSNAYRSLFCMGVFLFLNTLLHIYQFFPKYVKFWHFFKSRDIILVKIGCRLGTSTTSRNKSRGIEDTLYASVQAGTSGYAQKTTNFIKLGLNFLPYGKAEHRGYGHILQEERLRLSKL